LGINGAILGIIVPSQICSLVIRLQVATLLILVGVAHMVDAASACTDLNLPDSDALNLALDQKLVGGVAQWL